MWTLERQIRQLRCTNATRKKSNIAGKYSMLVEQGLTENVLSATARQNEIPSERKPLSI